MAFSENLQFLRIRRGITQEQLAERMEVSRQSVSKWESGLSYPEMDTLVRLCDEFHMDMDTLLRGDVQKAYAEDSAGYDQFMTGFARRMAGAIAGILAGMAVSAALPLFGFPDLLSMATLLLAVSIAVVVLVASGIEHDHFCKRYPTLDDFYTQQDRDRFQRKFVWYIAGGVGGILFGVALTALAFSFLPEREPYESIIGILFLLIIAVSVYFLVYGGMLQDKYDIAKYNRRNHPTPEDRAKSHRVGTACGVIMLLATALYVGLGLVWAMWQMAPVIYAVSGILCGVCGVLLGPRDAEE